MDLRSSLYSAILFSPVSFEAFLSENFQQDNKSVGNGLLSQRSAKFLNLWDTAVGWIRTSDLCIFSV